MPYVIHDADDLVGFRPIANDDALTERVFIRIELTRETFVDDRHQWRSVKIRLLERAPTSNLHSHRAEVVRCGDLKSGHWTLRRRDGLPFLAKCPPSLAPAEWQAINRADGRDSGQRPDSLDNLPVEIQPLRFVIFTIAVPRRRQVDFDCQQVRGLNADLHARQPQEAVQEQPGAHKHDQRQRDFRYDQRAEYSLLSRRAGSAAPALLERFVKVDLRRMKRRQHAENQAG